MIVAVLAKQIPNADEPALLDPSSHALVRTPPFILDDADSYSIEMGLQLVEEAGDGEVVLVSMAPAEETTGLRTGLAMGAARAVLVSDPLLAGSDALGTAKVLAAATRRIGADLVLTGSESSDGYTGTVPIQLAELLGLPGVSAATRVELSGDALLVHRQTDVGYDEIRCPLPAVVAVTAGVVEPRYPSFRGIMSAKSKPIDTLTIADLGLRPEEVGVPGAREEVVSVTESPKRAGGEVIVDTGDGHERILAVLREWKVIA